MFVPREIHEASPVLMNLSNVEPGNYPISEILEIRPELGQLRWNYKNIDMETRKFPSIKKTGFLWIVPITSFKFSDVQNVIQMRRCYKKNYNSPHSNGILSGEELLMRVFEILSGDVSVRASDTFQHYELAFEVIDFLLLNSKVNFGIQHIKNLIKCYCWESNSRLPGCFRTFFGLPKSKIFGINEIPFSVLNRCIYSFNTYEVPMTIKLIVIYSYRSISYIQAFFNMKFKFSHLKKLDEKDILSILEKLSRYEMETLGFSSRYF